MRSRSDIAGRGSPGGEFFAGSAGGPSFGLTDGGRLWLGRVGQETFLGNTSITDTSWHHVAVRRQGPQVSFFADGQLAGTQPCDLTFKLDGPFAIGALGSPFDGNSFGFIGTIDEFAAYGRALSQTEISNIHRAGKAGKCTSVPPITVALPVVNPSFEALTGTDPAYFDETGRLLLNHYSTFPGVPSLSIGFYSTNAIPGWTPSSPPRPITAGTINYRGSQYFPNGNPDGQNCAFINWVGYISQTLAETFQAGHAYRLSVDVGLPAGISFPGYVIGLYANGQAVAADTNTVTVPAGGFATAALAFTLPADSPAIGAPIEIRLGIPGDQPDQTVFDNVRLTAEPPAIVSLPVVNPSFEALTGTDPAYFDETGRLLLNHYSTFPGVPSLSIGFYSTNAIPGWTPSSPPRPITAGTINYRGSQYFPNGNPDGQNCAFINWVGYISQTLAETFQAGHAYRLSVDVGLPAGISFPGYVIGLYANGQAVAADTNTVTVPAGGFATATLAFTVPADSSAIGAPIEIRLGIPGDQPDQTVFDNVKLTVQTVVLNLPVVNPSFELLSGTDPTHFDASGKLLPGHYSEVPGFPILPIGFHTADPIPGWTSQDSAGTINYAGLPYFPAGLPDGQNCAWINITGTVSQTLAERFSPNTVYRLSVDVGALAGIAFPGYTVGLYANGTPVATEENAVSIPNGTFQTVTLTATIPPNSPALDTPIEIRLGIPGSHPDQVVFDNVRLTAEPALERLELLSQPALNPQSGLFEQRVRVTNLGRSALSGVRLGVSGLSAGIAVVNATGSVDGVPYVQSVHDVAPSGTVEFLVEFYSKFRQLVGSPVYTVLPVLEPSVPGTEGTEIPIARVTIPEDNANGGRVLLEFRSVPGKSYVIRYQNGLEAPWKTSLPAVAAAGTSVQWFDDGPPKTDTPPGDNGTRFYQVLELP